MGAYSSHHDLRRAFSPCNDSTAQPLIVYDRITKHFGDFVAIKELSLSIYEKEFFSLLGPTGCGKTTLMRMLAGFDDPTGGRILLCGDDITHIPPHRRPVNMMFQSYALFPHMNVEKNIAFGLKMDGLQKGEISARVEEMLVLVKLEKFAKRKPSELSGGQKQRVALARSVAKRPKVLLLDEPLGALDKKLREETQFELMDLQQRLGLTFVVVTHDQDEAMIMSDRIAVMNHGSIVQIGSATEIYQRPNNRYVANFVGEVTVIEGYVESIFEKTIQVASAQTGLLHRVASSSQVRVGQPVWLALRPEKMDMNLVVNKRPRPGSIRGKITDIGYLGKWTTYKIITPSGLRLNHSHANGKNDANRPFTWNDEVALSFEPGAAVLLTE